MSIIPDLSELQIERVEISDEITVIVRAASQTVLCPCCGTVAKKVQSRYTRQLHDLPSSGQSVHLFIQVRRFFCPKSTCARKIFAEPFPSLTRPHGQRTIRLQQTLRQLGFVLGGQAGNRLGKHLYLSGSRDTILRLLRQSDLPTPEPPRVVGVDEWAWKRGLRYGTLLCDLERGMPIDLLPDRSVKTVSAWFEKHPSIEVVSRDRSAEFAAAASAGAPQAVQVADRWYIIKNLGEALSALLARCRADKLRASRAEVLTEESRPEAAQEQRPYWSRKEEQARLARNVEREQRYAQIMVLHHQGFGSAAIASQLGMGARTVRDWLAQGSSPERRRRRRPSLIDSYENYVLKRWEEGCRNGAQLYEELLKQGYRGSPRAMYRYLARIRPAGSIRRQQLTPQEELSSAWATRTSFRTTNHLAFSAQIRRSQRKRARAIDPDQASES